MSDTLRAPHQGCRSSRRARECSRMSRESIGPLRSSSRRMWRRRLACSRRNSFPIRSEAVRPGRRRRMRARSSGKSSAGQMKAFHSSSLRSSQSRRSSSATSNGPRRLQRTSCWGGATVEIGSICRKPRCRTVSRIVVADPSSSCARTAILRASSVETILTPPAAATAAPPPLPIRPASPPRGRRASRRTASQAVPRSRRAGARTAPPSRTRS